MSLKDKGIFINIGRAAITPPNKVNGRKAKKSHYKGTGSCRIIYFSADCVSFLNTERIVLRHKIDTNQLVVHSADIDSFKTYSCKGGKTTFVPKEEIPTGRYYGEEENGILIFSLNNQII